MKEASFTWRITLAASTSSCESEIKTVKHPPTEKNYRRKPGALLIGLLLTGALIGSACNLAQRVVDSVPSINPTATLTVSPTAPAGDPDPTPPGTGPVEVIRPPDEIVAGQEPALLPGQTGSLEHLPDAPRYWIEVQIDFSGQAYQAVQRLDYTNTEGVTLDSLFFRLLPNGGAAYGKGSLEITALQVGGLTAQSRLSVSDSALEVLLPQPVAPGQKALIEMEFSGQVPKEFAGGGYGIFNFSQNVMSLSGWYPMLAVYDESGWNLQPVSNIGDSVYADIAFYEVQAAVSTPVTAAASGVDTQGQEGELSTSFTFISGPVREFYLALATSFKVMRQEVDGILVSSYYASGAERGAQTALEVAAASLRIFNERVGPYPYTQLDIVQTPMRYAAGVEFPGVILLASHLYAQSDRAFFPEVVAHEVAHMWWYNTVGNNVFTEPWLDEALTTYSSTLYFEFEQGPDAKAALIREWQQMYGSYTSQGMDAPITRDLAYFEQGSENLYSIVVYIKGALFFHALRQEIGDQAFFAALQNYYQEHAYGLATGQDLLDAFESAAGQQLDELYNQWLFSPP
jgi:hypothetical protein